MKLLVNRTTDNINIDVYCYEQDGEVEATHLKNEVPKDVDVVEKVEFVFRKPGYADSNVIIRNSNLKMEGEDTRMDINIFQDSVLRNLLIEWDLKDDDGQKVPLNTVSLNNLVPNLARAAVSGALDRIRI